MNRDPEKKPVTGVVNSEHYGIAHTIFTRFCSENNIKFNNVLRAAINTTVYDPAETNTIHVDHNFPHYNFLLYLNEFDNGSTILYNENEIITKKIIPNKFDVVVFPGQKHAHGHCEVGQRRVVMVVTFN